MPARVSGSRCRPSTTARELDRTGRREASLLRGSLAGYSIDLIVSSPLVRCLQTVAPLGKALGLDVEVRQRARTACDETGRAPPASRASPDGARVHPSGGPRVGLRRRDRVREGRRVGRRAPRSEPDARRLSSATGGPASPPPRCARLPVARPAPHRNLPVRGALTAASIRCALVDLYLVRHAIAEPRDPARWPDDALRPLSPEGVELFRLAARGLQRIGVEVEAVLASSYARAWRTAEILSEEAGWPPPTAAPGARGNELGFRGVRGRRLRDPSRCSRSSATSPTCRSSRRSRLRAIRTRSRSSSRRAASPALRFSGAPAAGRAELRWSASPKILRQLGR